MGFVDFISARTTLPGFFPQTPLSSPERVSTK
jgi:hypothetical protein